MWDTDLAKEFKNRNNESFIGVVVGTVENINPLTVSIYGGKALLTGDNLYVCKNATQYTMTVSTGGTATHEGLSQGDKVAVIATEDNQKLFVIDKLV